MKPRILVALAAVSTSLLGCAGAPDGESEPLDGPVAVGSCHVEPAPPAEEQYLAGDWDGDGRDNLAVRRNGCVLMDLDFTGGAEREQCFGNGTEPGEPTTEGCDEQDDEPAAAAGPVATLDGKRFTVFYQVGQDALAEYADPEHGLPRSSDHLHVFSHSGASQAVSPGLAALIHDARDDFRYAPAFDLNEHPGWLHASDAELRSWAHTFRDEALAGGADFFAFNEAPTDTPTNAQMRVQMATMLRALSAPDASGRSLRGIFFMTHGPSMPGNWDSPASAFWSAVDETCDAVVAEHYHGHGWVCTQSLDDISAHLLALREWLEQSGEPAKVSIANRKFTVLHSSRYSPGPSGWQGADSNEVTLAAFQRNLSRLALATRRTPGGLRRISFAPAYDAATVPGVHERIALLARWHYGQAQSADELACVDGFAGNCTCE